MENSTLFQVLTVWVALYTSLILACGRICLRLE